MHFKLFCFIEEYSFNLINNLPKTTSIIFRDYKKTLNINSILKTKILCKRRKIKLYLANNIKLALQLSLDGAYIPAFNNEFISNSYSLKKNFKLLGSAHNIKEIRTKEKQKVDYLFISPLFCSKKNNKELGIYRFVNLSTYTKRKMICLGGITRVNIKKINLIKPFGIAGISLFKNKLK